MTERKSTSTAVETSTAAAKTAATAAEQQESPKASTVAEGNSYLQSAQGESAPENAESEEEVFIQELLADLDFLNLKEKKEQTAAVQQQSQKILQQLQKPPKAVVPANSILLGILGPCQLQGHIVHFYNLDFKIEKHIRTIAELTDPRFVEAYHYLKKNPSVESVFVYNNKMRAYCRIGSRVVVRTISE